MCELLGGAHVYLALQHVTSGVHAACARCRICAPSIVDFSIALSARRLVRRSAMHLMRKNSSTGHISMRCADLPESFVRRPSPARSLVRHTVLPYFYPPSFLYQDVRYRPSLSGSARGICARTPFLARALRAPHPAPRSGRASLQALVEARHPASRSIGAAGKQHCYRRRARPVQRQLGR